MTFVLNCYWVRQDPSYTFIGIMSSLRSHRTRAVLVAAEELEKCSARRPANFRHSFTTTWVIVKIMVPFWIPMIMRHLVFRVPKKGHNFDNRPPIQLKAEECYTLRQDCQGDV